MSYAWVDLLQGRYAEALGWTLAHSVWELSVVAGVFWAVGRLLGGGGARARYAVACAGMAVMVMALAGTYGWMLKYGGGAGGTAAAMEARGAVPVAAAQVAAGPAARAWRGRAAGVMETWIPAVVAAYLMGAVICSLRLAGGMLMLRRVRKGARALSGPVGERLLSLGRRCGIRGVRLLETAAVEVPAVVGLLRPVVLVPASALTGLTEMQLRLLIAHEFGHLRRWDHVVHHVQLAVETVLFYHPAVWWISAWMRREREFCCDDLAVAACGDRAGYARALATMEGLRSAGALALAAQGAGAGGLLGRIRRVLGEEPVRRRGERAGPMAAAVVMMGVIAYMVGCAAKGGAGREAALPALTPGQVLIEAAYYALPAGVSARDLMPGGQLAVDGAGAGVQTDPPAKVELGFPEQQREGLIKALEKAHASKLYQPRILTKATERARLMIGETMAYIAGYKPQAAAAGAGVEPDVKQLFTGFVLDCTPYFVDAGVRLKVVLEVSALARMDAASSPPDAPGRGSPVNVPVINRQSASMEVVVKNGRSVVLVGPGPQDGKTPGQQRVLILTPRWVETAGGRTKTP